MLKTVIGNVPQTINYYHSTYSPSIQEFLYPVDAINKKANDNQSSTHSKIAFTEKNEIIKNLKLDDIHYRVFPFNNTNSSLYVTYNDKYKFEVSKEVIIESILNDGISENGVLNSEFIWINHSGKLYLVSLNSKLYSLVKEYESKENIKKIPKSKLKPGFFYKDRKNEVSIFIGFVDSNEFKKSNTPYKFDWTLIPIQKTMMFYPADPNAKITFDFNYLKRMNSHSFIEELHSININPLEIFNNYRKYHIDKVRERIGEYAKRVSVNTKLNYELMSLHNYIEYNSFELNLYLHKSTPVEVFDAKKYLNFV